jgi:hypothetical protein
MRIPPVTGRIRAEGVVAAPAQVLRVAFAQVGRLVMAADEFRGRIQADRASGPARPPAAAGEPAPAAGPGVTRASAATAAPPLPVPNYDELSLASLRARLRYLDAAQLRILVQYERSHAGRPAIVTMFERRMAKLAAQ